MVVVGQSGCIRAKVVVFVKNCFYSGKCGSFRTKRLHFGKVVLIWHKWLYSGRVVVFWQSGCYWEKVVVFG